MSSDQLIVFVKAPRPGTVKTRLAKSIGADQACAAYRQLVDAVLRAVGEIGSVELRFAPDDGREEIATWVREGWSAQPQGEGDLGERLVRAIDDAFERGAKRVAVIGSDCAELDASDIKAAFRELSRHDLVVGPAVDGGYWLLALRAPQPELFRGVEWSTDQVLGQTLQRAKSLGLRVQLLRILSDIDTEAEWRQFVRQSRGNPH